MDYSVLMSVYHKEKAEYLRESMESIFAQTVPTNDFVLVCDGPLGTELETVIADMLASHSDVLHLVRLEKNMGLGNALNEGIRHCKNELVARMDSDDIAVSERCESQLSAFMLDRNLDIMSSTVLEFEENIDSITGKRALPLAHDAICTFSRKRNPFNHPVVMFRKSAVEAAGGYKETYHLFEDYYLWVRMLINGCKGYNTSTPLLFMRVSRDIYRRRGGIKYAVNLLRFHWWIKTCGWGTYHEFMFCAIPHAIICVLPSCIRALVYKVIH